MRYADDPRRFETTVVDLLQTYAPAIHARIDPDTFALSRPLDLCHAAITPTARAGYIRLDNGRCVVALGDAHVVNDPIIGQGANTAVHAAWTLGAAICETDTYDEAFCREVARRVWAFTGPVTAGTNARLGRLDRICSRCCRRRRGIRSWRMATPGVSTILIVSGARWPVRRAPPRSWPILPAIGASHPASESFSAKRYPKSRKSRRRS